VLLLAAAGLRAAVSMAYWPALELKGDSYTYLYFAHVVEPGTWHPLVYSLFLRMMAAFQQVLPPAAALGTVTAAQHLMALGLGVLIYVLMLRFGVRPWLAALAAVPVLFDAYQLDVEQFILAETLTDVLLVGGLALVVWRRKVTAWQGALVGLLLVAATFTRVAVAPVIVVVALYLLLRRHWRSLLTYLVVSAAGLVGYGAWYGSVNGHFGYSSYGGYSLYGQVARFATCDYHLPPAEAALCPSQPVSRRPQGEEFWLWSPASPLNRGAGPLAKLTQPQRNAVAKRFDKTVIRHQPLAYAYEVAAESAHYFAPGRWQKADRIELKRFRFPKPDLNGNVDLLHVYFANAGFANRPITAHVDPALMGFLRSYQSVAYTQGPILLAALLGALAVGVRLFERRKGRREARWAALVLAGAGVALVLTPSLAAGFSYRYGIPLLVVLPPAGILAADIGLDALRAGLGRLRRPAGRQLAPVGSGPARTWAGNGGRARQGASTPSSASRVERRPRTVSGEY